MNGIIVASDFSGLGAFEEALKRLKVNHRIAFACDKDKYAKHSYLANHNPEIFYDDITTRNQSETPYSDIYCFGFPCQAFSIAGNRKGFEDTRGTLFFNSLEYIKQKQPLCFIAENVKGLLSHDKGKTFSVIKDALAYTVNGQHNLYKYDDCVNYHLYYFVLNSKKYGIPQNRERIFLIGFKKQVEFKKPSSFKLPICLNDLLENNVDEKYYLSDERVSKLIFKKSDNKIGYINQNTQASQVYSTDNLSPTICAGSYGYAIGYIKEQTILRWQNKKDGIIEDNISPTLRIAGMPTEQFLELNKNGTSNTLTSVQKDNLVLISLFGTQSNSQGMRVYDSNGLSCTMSSNGGGVGAKTGLYLIDYRIRRLTPKEVFRLMGYSDEFFEQILSINTVSDTQLYKMGGNSIVVDTLMYLLIEVCKSLKIPFTIQNND